MTHGSIDKSFAIALRGATRAVAPQPADRSFLEKRLASALGTALETKLAPLSITLNRKLPGVVLEEWDPQPGSFDLAAIDHNGSPVVVAELKLDDVDQTLWDIFKLASALRLPSVEAAYVVVGAPRRVWQSDLDVVDLYRESEPREWSTRFLFKQYRLAWQSLLRGGRGRPIALPSTIFLTPLLTLAVPHYPPYELRALRISRSDVSLPIIDGWPSGESRAEGALEPRAKGFLISLRSAAA